MPFSMPPIMNPGMVLPQYMQDAMRRQRANQNVDNIAPYEALNSPDTLENQVNDNAARVDTMNQLPAPDTINQQAAQGGGGPGMANLIQAAAPPLPPPEDMPQPPGGRMLQGNLPDALHIGSLPDGGIPHGGDYGFDQDNRINQKTIRGGVAPSDQLPAHEQILSAHERAVRDLGGEKYQHRSIGQFLGDLGKGALTSFAHGGSPLKGAIAGGIGEYRQAELDKNIARGEKDYSLQDATDRQGREDAAKRAEEESKQQQRQDATKNAQDKLALGERTQTDRAKLFSSIEEYKRRSADSRDAGQTERMIRDLEDRRAGLNPQDPDTPNTSNQISNYIDQLRKLPISTAGNYTKPEGTQIVQDTNPGGSGNVQIVGKQSGKVTNVPGVHLTPRQGKGAGGSGGGRGGDDTTETTTTGGTKTIINAKGQLEEVPVTKHTVRHHYKGKRPANSLPSADEVGNMH